MSSSQEVKDDKDKLKPKCQESEEKKAKRLPKRLTYLLRYGAVKEGLEVDQNGFVNLSELATVPLLTSYSESEILNEIKSSNSIRNVPRFHVQEKDGKILVRASYLRRFEQNPYHKGTKVKTLSEASMNCILDNLESFDLEDFQDEYMIKLMIHRMKRKKALNNTALSILFVPTITRIDLEGIYLTQKSLKLLWTQCPNLKGISLKNCGYIMTDAMLCQLVKNLPGIEQLNLERCTHLSDQSLAILSKRLSNLQVLRMPGVRAVTPPSVLKFLKAAKNLTFLDVFFMKTSSRQEYKSLMECAKENGVELVLRPYNRRNKSEILGDDDNDNNNDDNSSIDKDSDDEKLFSNDYSTEEEEEEEEEDDDNNSDDNDDDDDDDDNSIPSDYEYWL